MYCLCSLLGWLVNLLRTGLQAGLATNWIGHLIETLLNVVGGTVLGSEIETVVNGVLGCWDEFRWMLIWLLNVC